MLTFYLLMSLDLYVLMWAARLEWRTLKRKRGRA